MNRSVFLDRQRRLTAKLPEHKLDGLLVSAPANILYLSGFACDNALLLVEPGRTVLFTDPRYRLSAQAESACQVKIERRPLILAAAAWATRRLVRRLGFEKDHLSYGLFQQLEDTLPASFRLTPAGSLVETLRAVKDEHELERIRRSSQLASQALLQILPSLRPGVRESEVAAELEHNLLRLSGEKAAFEPIVAFGPHSAEPHARPGANCLKTNDLILIDCGATHGHYASDMTRMFHLGPPEARKKHLYEVVLEAQQAALSRIRPGVTAASVDAAARKVLARHGLHKAFVHATGHGLGLEIHERPRLARADRTCLEEGMAVTVEPGVYLQELGGIRIEDTVAVTRTGCEILTTAPKEFIVI